MAFSFKVYAPNASATTVDLSANPPSAGDVLIAWSVSDSTGTSGVGPGTGWTQINGAWQVTTTDSQSLSVWIKNTVAVGGETSLDVTTSTVNLNGVMAIGGVDQTTFLDVAAPAPTNNNTGVGSPASITLAITPVTNGALLIAVKGTDTTASTDATHAFSDTGAATWTTRADQQDGFRNVGVGTAVQALAAATTVSGTSTFSTGNAGQAMFVLALRPAVTVGALDGAGRALSNGLGTLTVTALLLGSGLARATSTAALSTRADLAGTGNAPCSGNAALTTSAVLAGSGHAGAAGLGQLASGAVFAGSGAALSHGGGALTVRAVLAGDGRARADGFATLAVRVALAGAGRVAAAGAAVLAVPYRSPDLLGNIPLWRLKARFAAQEPAGATFSGTGAARSLGAGTLTVRAAPAGSGQANAAGLGVLAVRAVLAGVGVARSSGEGALNSGAVLSGSGAAAASGQAQLTVRVALVGSGLAAAEGLGNLAGPGAVLVGSGVARAASQADLQPQYAALQAIASAQASSIAALRVYAALVGTGSVITSGRGVLPSAGGETPVPEQVFKLTTASRIFRLATVTRINEKAGA